MENFDRKSRTVTCHRLTVRKANLLARWVFILSPVVVSYMGWNLNNANSDEEMECSEKSNAIASKEIMSNNGEVET